VARKGKGRNGGTLYFWEKGESGNPNGRPRKVLSRLQEEVGVEFNVSLTKADKWAILEAMLEMNMNDLGKIATDKECPAFMVVIANAIREDIKKGRIWTVSELFDRFFGKPVQVNKIQDREGDQILDEMDPSERKNLIAKYLDINDGRK